MEYDCLNRLTSVTNTEGEKQCYYYDCLGRMTGMCIRARHVFIRQFNKEYILLKRITDFKELLRGQHSCIHGRGRNGVIFHT